MATDVDRLILDLAARIGTAESEIKKILYDLGKFGRLGGGAAGTGVGNTIAKWLDVSQIGDSTTLTEPAVDKLVIKGNLVPESDDTWAIGSFGPPVERFHAIGTVELYADKLFDAGAGFIEVQDTPIQPLTDLGDVAGVGVDVTLGLFDKRWLNVFSGSFSHAELTGIYWGSGSPETVLIADRGSLYLNILGGTDAVYSKQADDGLATGWATVGGVSGTTDYLAMFGPTGTAVIDSSAKWEHTGSSGGTLHLTTATSLEIDNTAVIAGQYSTTNGAILATVSALDRVIFGPHDDASGSPIGAEVVIRSGHGPDPIGQLWIDGTVGHFTFNDTATNNAARGHLLLRPISDSVDGFKFKNTATYAAAPFAAVDDSDVDTFVVEADGNLENIRGKKYLWPNAAFPAAPRVLGYSSINGAGQAVLGWVAPGSATAGSGIVGPGTLMKVARFVNVAGDTVGDSNILDDDTVVATSLIRATANEIQIAQRVATEDRIQLSFFTPAFAAEAIWRYEHDPAVIAGIEPLNTTGEMELILGAATRYVILGAGRSIFQTPLRVRTISPYTGAAIDVLQPGGSTVAFRVDSQDGDLNVIRGKDYNWPTTIPAPGSGKFLGYTNTGTPTLQWLDPTAGLPSALTGRATYFPKFQAPTGASQPLTDTSALSEDSLSLYEATHHFALDEAKSIYLGGTAEPRSEALHWQLSPLRLFVGMASGTTGEVIEFRTGAQTPINTGVGRFYIDGNLRRLTFNALDTSNPGVAFYMKPNADDSGFWVNTLTAGSTGFPFVAQRAGATTFFVSEVGDVCPRNIHYLWPSTLPTVAPTLRFLQVDQVTGQLSWVAAPGGVGATAPTTANQVTKWASPFTGNITDSGINDDGASIIARSTSVFRFKNANTTVGFDQCETQWDTNPGNRAIWRFQHNSASYFFPAGNGAGGEMQLFLTNSTNPSTPYFFVGDIGSWFQSGLRVRPFPGYPATVGGQPNGTFECWAPGAGLANFRIDTAGDLTLIKGQPYLWPAASPTAVNQVLTCNNATTKQLVWQAPVGSGGITGFAPTSAFYLTKWQVGGSSITDSGVYDDGTFVSLVNRSGFLRSGLACDIGSSGGAFQTLFVTTGQIAFLQGWGGPINVQNTLSPAGGVSLGTSAGDAFVETWTGKLHASNGGLGNPSITCGDPLVGLVGSGTGGAGFLAVCVGTRTMMYWQDGVDGCFLQVDGALRQITRGGPDPGGSGKRCLVVG